MSSYFLTRFFGTYLYLFFIEARVFQDVHGGNGVIRCGQVFFRADSRYPVLHRVFVGLTKAVEFRDIYGIFCVFHCSPLREMPENPRLSEAGKQKHRHR